MILGLGTVVYKVSDLDQAKVWYQGVFGVQPYFDEPFYVGFNIEGYERGLDPASSHTPPGPGGADDSARPRVEHDGEEDESGGERM